MGNYFADTAPVNATGVDGDLWIHRFPTYFDIYARTGGTYQLAIQVPRYFTYMEDVILLTGGQTYTLEATGTLTGQNDTRVYAVDGPAVTVEYTYDAPGGARTWYLYEGGYEVVGTVAGWRFTRTDTSGEISKIHTNRRTRHFDIPTNGPGTGSHPLLSAPSAAASGGLDTEAVQDVVAAMLGNVGTYDDAAGTYTITLPTARTDEEIQDLVAALVQVSGGAITRTYDDAGNVLTLTVTGTGGSSLTVAEVDGSPSVTATSLIFPNGSLTNNSGAVTYTPPVSSVNGQTGAVTLTTANLSDFTEALQDAVAGMIVAGTNITRTYDDTAGTLTINSTASGSATLTYLSTPSTLTAASPTTVTTTNVDTSLFHEFTPTVNYTLAAVRSTRDATTITARALVFRKSDQALLGTGDSVSNASGTMTSTLASPVTLTAGVTYLIGFRLTGGSGNFRGGTQATTHAGFTTTNVGYYFGTGTAYPTGSGTSYWPIIDLISQAAGTKGVIGPLDPADFPTVSATSAMANSSGAMLVNDTAKTASLVWKFSDGTTKSVSLT